jgi:hypothetical protein
MPDIRYEVRFHFDAPALAGQGADAAVIAMMEAGIPMSVGAVEGLSVVPDPVALEDGEYRDLTEVESAAFDAGMQQGGPTAGTLEVEVVDD